MGLCGWVLKSASFCERNQARVSASGFRERRSAKSSATRRRQSRSSRYGDDMDRRRLAECGKLKPIAQVAFDRSGRVLVVDDDALIRDTLATALGDEGYTVRVASDGRAALVTIGTWRPDVIVLDLMMPVMDGPSFRAAQRETAETAQIPVIVLSATHEVHGRAANLGAAAIFAKPFDLGALLEVIA